MEHCFTTYKSKFVKEYVDFQTEDVMHSDKSIREKPKERLVACGFQQVPGVHYNDTYFSVANFTSVHAGQALSVHFDFDPHQLDIVTAFLNKDFVEDVYMEVLDGIMSDKSKKDFVWKLNQALHG